MKPLSKTSQTLLLLGVGIVVLVSAIFMSLHTEELSLSLPHPNETAHQQRGGTPEKSVAREHPAPTSSVVLPAPAEWAVPLQPTLLSGQTIVGVVLNNAQGEEMGTVREILLDPVSGLVHYAVVDTGSFLGFGKRQSFAVPWNALRVKLGHTDVVVRLNQSQFPMSPALVLGRR